MLRGAEAAAGDSPLCICVVPAAEPRYAAVCSGVAPELLLQRLRGAVQPRSARRRRLLQLPKRVRQRRPESLQLIDH